MPKRLESVIVKKWWSLWILGNEQRNKSQTYVLMKFEYANVNQNMEVLYLKTKKLLRFQSVIVFYAL